jgi:hypothetical protein
VFLKGTTFRSYVNYCKRVRLKARTSILTTKKVVVSMDVRAKQAAEKLYISPEGTIELSPGRQSWGDISDLNSPVRDG